MRLVSVALFLGLLGCAGMQPITQEETTFSGIYEAPGQSKDAIFTGAKVWVAQKFVSAKAVIEHENKQEGVLIGNGITEYPCKGMGCALKSNWGLAFTMRVDVKDEKFKLTFTNVTFDDGLALNMRGDLPAIKEKLLSFGPEIQAAVKKNEAAKDW